jgi:hypothetical protein
MAMEGGAMGGYCEIGRVWMASPPATIKMMAMTQAKTGRFRKNLDNMARFRYFEVEAGWAGVTGGLGLLSKGTAFTAAPGRTFNIPSTITRSPGVKPVATSHWSPIARSRLNKRGSTLPAAFTIRAAGISLGVA